jgi:anaerobic ribonucleoside-triphosphate reductase activating protein
MSWNKPASTLNIAHIIRNSQVNGPGRRMVIWLQGCSKCCVGCINHDYWANEPRMLIPVTQVASMAMEINGIEGITFSGGEPFEQAAELYQLSTILKDNGYSIMSYSGLTYDELNNNNKDHQLLLSRLDILIDGSFKKELAKPLLWRGSSNQRVYFLTDRYRNYSDKTDIIDQRMELSLQGNTLALSGSIEEELFHEIKIRLNEHGINLTGER